MKSVANPCRALSGLPGGLPGRLLGGLVIGLVVGVLIPVCPLTAAPPLPQGEAEVIGYLTDRGVRIETGADGHAVRLMSSGKAPMTAEEYQLIGQLKQLQQVGINGAPLNGDQWGFLKQLPNLKRLSIWHGHEFADLKAFSGLPVESLTIGGCMGLRDLNRDHPQRLRHAITTLRDLPNLTHGNWYHSPLIPDDLHLVHLASEFPKLESLRLDFKAPRGMETTISPQGLAHLQRLSLKVLNLENASSFTPEHFQAIAGIDSLQTLLIDARRSSPPREAIAAFERLRPQVDVVVAGPDAKGPPRVPARQ